MQVLGIETTCDETAAAVVRLRPDGTGEILADEVMSQIAAHAPYGGVVPEIAARAHVEIVDSLIVDTGHDGRDGKLLLFVVLGEGVKLDDGLRGRIVGQIREQLSPRHTPDEIVQVETVPRTLTGKKMEIPVKRILGGAEPSVVASADAMQDPAALAPFVELARKLSSD